MKDCQEEVFCQWQRQWCGAQVAPESMAHLWQSCQLSKHVSFSVLQLEVIDGVWENGCSTETLSGVVLHASPSWTTLAQSTCKNGCPEVFIFLLGWSWRTLLGATLQCTFYGGILSISLEVPQLQHMHKIMCLVKGEVMVLGGQCLLDSLPSSG